MSYHYTMKSLPQNYSHKEAEKRWQQHWVSSGTYRWHDDSPRDQTYVIDTPPPTVSGLLHMGHVFSYTQCDFVARYQRMIGKDVFYPMGFDDNGLPTERLVEKVHKKRATDYPSREDFTKVCDSVAEEARRDFRALFQSIALSVDWNQEYHTISPEVQAISQASFIDLVQKDEVVRRLQPFFWDPIDQTAIAQAEIEDKTLPSHHNIIPFGIVDAGTPAQDIKWGQIEKIKVMTTRPELLGACVALMCHPDDATRFKGKQAVTPLYGVVVDIIADEKVSKEKGTGFVMCCTFGDETDIAWWREHKLPMRVILNKYAKLELLDKDWLKPEKDRAFCSLVDAKWKELQGLKVTAAREKTIEILREMGLLLEQEAITHTVKCAERSGAPLEILPTQQWFVKVTDKKDELKARAQECVWHPDWMRLRIEQWIDGLNSDWCISRQRYFGVPFPVWYVTEVETNDFSQSTTENNVVKGKTYRALNTFNVLPSAEQLPINPLDTDDTRNVFEALGYVYSKSDLLGGGNGPDSNNEWTHIFEKDGKTFLVRPDADVMDTWATSSISPQISAGAISAHLSHGERSNADIPHSGEGHHLIPRDILDYARELRQNQTDAEQLLWSLLRRQSLGAKFRRQHPIGRAIADFCCVEKKLVIELDGGQHAEETAAACDEKRTAALEADGYRVLRVWNHELFQHTDTVLETIWNALQSHPLPESEIPTSPNGRGDRFASHEANATQEARFQKLFPADLRPQAHEIIRTWAFYTIVKAHLHGDTIPWKNLMISGWCLAEDKTKMSKSKGNVVTPVELIEEQGTDAVRYWAATSRLGQDTAYSTDLLKIGKKLVTKLWNATKFAAIHFDKLEAAPTTAAGDVKAGIITEALDLWILTRLQRAVKKATEAFDAYEYCDALRAAEDFFWNDFCDNYLELVKKRVYDEDGANPAAQQSAAFTIYHALDGILRLFAPFVPHITEELFAHLFPASYEHTGSLHARKPKQHAILWPAAANYPLDAQKETLGIASVALLNAIRKTKSERGVSIKAPVALMTLYPLTHGPEALTADALALIAEDVKAAGSVETIQWQTGTASAEAMTTDDGRFAVEFTFGQAAAA